MCLERKITQKYSECIRYVNGQLGRTTLCIPGVSELVTPYLHDPGVAVCVSSVSESFIKTPRQRHEQKLSIAWLGPEMRGGQRLWAGVAFSRETFLLYARVDTGEVQQGSTQRRKTVHKSRARRISTGLQRGAR